MKLIPVNQSEKKIKVNNEVLIHRRTFKELGLFESSIEEFLKQNAEEVFEEENLFIVGQQVQNTSKGITDLVALDENGNIVLIEIKRDLEDIIRRKEKFEFQAIRYAASFAKVSSPLELVDRVFSQYIEKNPEYFPLGDLTAREKGLRLIDEFLRENESLKTFNNKQRIILIASEFDSQTESAVAWLVSNNVDISCFTIQPIEIDQKLYISAERILPPPSLEDFYVDVNHTPYPLGQTTVKARVVRSKLPKMDKLFEWRIIQKGDSLYVKNREAEKGIAHDETFVEVDNEKLTYHQWCKKVTGWSSVQTYAMIIKEESGKTLSEMRKQKMEDLEDASSL